MNFLETVLGSGLRIATPIGFAALGETFSERAGVVNVQIEGMMLTGAFTGVLGAKYSGSGWVGLLCALLAGAGVAALHAVISIMLGADQIVSGIALNLLALGLTSFLLPVFFGDNGATVAGLGVVDVPWLHDIPLIGPVLFEQASTTYVLYAAVPIAAVVLHRTAWGLRVQACGENPHGADAVGVNVFRIRLEGVLLSGAMAGLGGGVLSLQGLRFFTDNMTPGRGFIAIAAVIFGNWSPVRVVLATAFFGSIDALQLRLQATGVPIPGELLIILPYVAALVVLAGFVGRSRLPSQLAQAYRRG
jgi:ABC-type uncharacterized transport system permease subunit